jgi:predicted esterase
MQPHLGQPLVSAGEPLGQGRAVLVMVHGRGAAPANILDLVPRLDRPGLTYLAPTAAGKTWYPQSFMADREGNEPGLSSGLKAVGRAVDQALAAGVPSERIVLLGFSQGACLTSEFAVRNARRYGGVIAYTGGLIGPPGTAWGHDGAFDGTPVFLGCSDVDAHVPLVRVEESAAVFARMGAAVTKRIYAGMGHVVNDDEIRFTQRLLDGLTPSARDL